METSGGFPVLRELFGFLRRQTMVHTEIAVQPHVSDTPDYIDALIDDLHKALEKAEAAMDKLRDTSKLRVSHRTEATEAMPESFALSGIGIGRHSQVSISSSPVSI
jgi:hypothetical protein